MKNIRKTFVALFLTLGSLAAIQGQVDFADESYKEIEEEYLTRPDAKVIKTIIRYRIKKK